MKIYGLIGYPLSHSFSQTFFNEKFFREDIKETQYKNFELKSIELFPLWLKENSGICGLNVTIPYKEKIINYLDELDNNAKKVGAVNTIKVLKNGKTRGFNTDITGFEKTFTPYLKNHHNKALILGTGGAAKAVQYVLRKKNILYTSVSRTEKNNAITYEELDKQTIKSHPIIINTTPVGQSPNDLDFPDIPYTAIGKDHLVYDLIYNPPTTIFMIKAKQNGAKAKGGLEMLYIQAEAAWDIWNNELYD